MNYREFQKRFPSENAAIAYIIEKIVSRQKYKCHRCGTTDSGIYHQHHDPKLFYCSHCKSEFSALIGTIFEHTDLDLRMWLYAINAVMYIAQWHIRKAVAARVGSILSHFMAHAKIDKRGNVKR